MDMYEVPKQSVRFVPEVAALDTVFVLRPLQNPAHDAFAKHMNEMYGDGSDSYHDWWVHPWEYYHNVEDGTEDEEDWVTKEEWDAMYECAKAVGLPDGESVMVDVTW